MYDDRRISTSSQHQGMQGSSSETISYERREHKAIFQEMFYNLDKREFFLMRDGLIKGYLRDVEMESKDHEVLIYNRDLKKMVQEYITIL